MAAFGVEPAEANPLLARRALEAHLARRREDDPEIIRVDDLVVHVPLLGLTAEGSMDDYLLRLELRHYDEWPPSTQFVNPETGTFVPGPDNRHLPRIEGTNEIFVHPAYGPGLQLICSSVTLEFYLVGHGGEAKHLWQQGTHTIWSTIYAVRRHLRPPWYRGRQG